MSSKKKNALLLLVNSVVFLALYFLMLHLDVWFITPIYVVLAALVAGAFIVYNRGFAAKGATVDSLPCTMSLEAREDFIREARERMEKSRWMITVILPLILAVAIDAVMLFVLPYLAEAFS